MNRKLLQRIIITVTGVPLFLSVIFLFPQYNHGIYFLVICFFSYTGSVEVKNMCEAKYGEKMIIPPWVCLIFPAVAYISLYNGLGFLPIFTLFILTVLAVSAWEIIRGSREEFTGSLTRVMITLFMIIYPNLLTPYVVFLAGFDRASYLIMLFYLLVFSNDIFAYVFGMIFGRNSRGIVKASPNKSLAGFAGGGAMTVAIAFAYTAIFSSQLPPAPWWFLVLTALVISFVSNLGDLFESVLKRSVQVKDSGSIMPGRGGILDSIDSIIFAAPVFYYIAYIWYTYGIA